MSFPSDAYDAWKTTPDAEPETSREDQWGYDPEREHDANYYADEQDNFEPVGELDEPLVGDDERIEE